MSTDPRTALEAFVSALYEHLAAATNKRGNDDPNLDRAYEALAEAYIGYEEALADATGEYTPFDLDEDDDDYDDYSDHDDDIEFEDLNEEDE